MRMVALLVFAVFLLSGCGPQRGEVAGSYAGTLGGATESLVLHTNGTFSQSLTLASGQKTNSSGTWRLDYKAVKLDGYLLFYDGMKNGALVEPTRVHGMIYVWGAKMLIRDWDSGYYTLKRDK